MYETIMGSEAYGVASGNSDRDIYGFAIPPKEVIFPHLAGEILGFGRQKKRFEQYQEHHIDDPTAQSGRGLQWDLQIFSIVKYFTLAMENNPNMIDSLFTPAECVIHSTQVGQMVREQRRLFLHKGCWHKFKGYAYAQLNAMGSKNPIGKRKELVERHGFDCKFAYHVVRLLDEAEQILTLGDINLRRNAEHLKAIRRGDVSEEDIRKWAADKEAQLESVYHTSTLPYSPDEAAIKALLLECLEHHYGSLEKAVVVEGAAETALRQIAEIVDKLRY